MKNKTEMAYVYVTINAVIKPIFVIVLVPLS